jgi:hypothetical protein
MPTYTFKNANTGEVEEHTLKLSEYDKFKQDNTHLERYFAPEDLPRFSDAARMSVPGTKSYDSAFEKGVIQRIKDTVPGNTLAKSHKTKMGREW